MAPAWVHKYRIAEHPQEADIDCSALGIPGKFAVAGDFDGDKRAEIAIALDAQASAGNDFWVMKLNDFTWEHLSPISGHPQEADLDCSPLGFSARFAVAGDFDHDGSDELAIAIDAPGSGGSDFWVMKYDPGARTWAHLSPIPNHPLQADIDCSTLGFAAKFAVVGDFDGDHRPEIAIGVDAPGSGGNDFWVMKYDPQARAWFHLSPIANHPVQADIDCSTAGVGARAALVGRFDPVSLSVPDVPRDSIAVIPDAGGSEGNELWVMKYDLQTRAWFHLSPIPNHPRQADIDCSAAGVPAGGGLAGDFDGDELSEIALVIGAGGSKGNDLWVMKYDALTRAWFHVSPIANHPFGADIDCSKLGFALKLGFTADFDGDRHDEIAVSLFAPDSKGNDLWVMKFDPGSRTWSHLSPIANHETEADIDCSTLGFPVAFGAAGDFDNDGRAEIAMALDADDSAGNDLWVMSQPDCIRVRFKIVLNPDPQITNLSMPTADMVASANEVYATVGLQIQRLLPDENLNLPSMNVVKTGGCFSGITTQQQKQLFQNRNSVGPKDIVVYCVFATIPPGGGCASFPAGFPGAVITHCATQWTLGHEIGHVLGLGHVNDSRRLMFEHSDLITDPPPDLELSEGETMRKSGLVVSC